MRKKKALSLVVGGGALLCLAAASASYLLWPAVMDSGGGHAESSSHQVDASIGGPVIAPSAAGGEASSANYKLEVNSVGVLTKGVQVQPAPGGGGGCVPACPGANALALAVSLACLASLRRS